MTGSGSTACPHCGADLSLERSVRFRTRDCAASNGVSGGLRGEGRYGAEGNLTGVLDGGTVRTPVTAWCGECRNALPGDMATVEIR